MNKWNKYLITCLISAASCTSALAQNEMDAVMMGKNNLCVAAAYGRTSWDKYWEGTLKRENLNIGKFSSQTVTAMLNYGIKNNLNVMVSLPYVSTKTSAGTLAGLSGFQDISVYLKYRPVRVISGSQKFSVFAIGGYSIPSHNYNIDLLPVSIGMGSNVTTGRVVVDYLYKGIFLSASGSYMYRSNVTIDRSSYYTTRQINSSEVQMPNMGSYQLRAGYRSSMIIAEALFEQTKTFGGFDIRRNDMPFVSNEMNSTNVGFEGKYYLPQLPELGIHAMGWHTVKGRNVGQANGFMAGILYNIRIAKHPLSRQ